LAIFQKDKNKNTVKI